LVPLCFFIVGFGMSRFRGVIGGGDGEGPTKVTFIFWLPHGDMLQFLPPGVPPPKYFRGCSWGGPWKM
jgi:hypothetical protein